MMFLSVTLGLPFSQVREMSSAEISLYMAYYRLEPWGEERADLRNAMALQQTAEMHRDRKKRTEPFRLEDFMPFRKKHEAEPEEVTTRARSAFRKLASLGQKK